MCCTQTQFLCYHGSLIHVWLSIFFVKLVKREHTKTARQVSLLQGKRDDSQSSRRHTPSTPKPRVRYPRQPCWQVQSASQGGSVVTCTECHHCKERAEAWPDLAVSIRSHETILQCDWSALPGLLVHVRHLCGCHKHSRLESSPWIPPGLCLGEETHADRGEGEGEGYTQHHKCLTVGWRWHCEPESPWPTM